MPSDQHIEPNSDIAQATVDRCIDRPWVFTAIPQAWRYSMPHAVEEQIERGADVHIVEGLLHQKAAVVPRSQLPQWNQISAVFVLWPPSPLGYTWASITYPRTFSFLKLASTPCRSQSSHLSRTGIKATNTVQSQEGKARIPVIHPARSERNLMTSQIL